MDAAGQANEVIDKVAEKMGEAADKLAPLAETIVQEYVKMNLIEAAGCLLGLGVLFTLAIFVSRRWKRMQMDVANTESAVAATWIVAAVVGIGPLAGLIGSLAHAASPHYHIAAKLLGN